MGVAGQAAEQVAVAAHLGVVAGIGLAGLEIRHDKSVRGRGEKVRAMALALRTLHEPRYAEAREGFLTWLRRVLLPGRFPGLQWSERLDLPEDEAMLAERVRDWTRVWRQEGLEQGLSAGRHMLLRQVDRRFGAATADAAEPLLAGIDSPERLGQVGEWVIDCEAPEDLLARLRGIAA